MSSNLTNWLEEFYTVNVVGDHMTKESAITIITPAQYQLDDSRGTIVPLPTVEQLNSIQEYIADNKLVYISNELLNATVLVDEIASVDDNPVIRCLYDGKLILSYTISNGAVSIEYLDLTGPKTYRHRITIYAAHSYGGINDGSITIELYNSDPVPYTVTTLPEDSFTIAGLRGYNESWPFYWDDSPTHAGYPIACAKTSATTFRATAVVIPEYSTVSDRPLFEYWSGDFVAEAPEGAGGIPFWIFGGDSVEEI